MRFNPSSGARSYNERTCSGPTAAGSCRSVPEALNKDARLSSNLDLFFQHYALSIRPLAPTLSYTWKVASEKSSQSAAEESEPHKRWLYFLGFAALAGGKISFASASLFKNSRRNLSVDGRSLICVCWRAMAFIPKAILRLAFLISRGRRVSRAA